MIRFGKLTIEEFNNKYDGVDYSVKPSERQKGLMLKQLMEKCLI